MSDDVPDVQDSSLALVEPEQEGVRVTATTAVVAAVSRSTPCRILVVDDDEWIRDLLSVVLSRHQYTVHTFPTAEEGLHALRTSSYDAVLSDMNLPGMNGLDFTARVTLLRPDLPVILITGQCDADLMRSALRNGASDFLTKPFDAATIPMVIERNLERHSLERQRILELEDSVVVNSVRVLAAAIDAKEPFTAEHSRRVSHICLALADTLQLSPTDRRLVEISALVHDVGKIGTPDSILNKAGKLTDEEWEVMRQHTVQGAEIVGRVPQLTYVADIIRHHHERMDGRGYPDGLAGDAIPMLARIITVADAYEVMTSDRVYHTRIRHEEANARLVRSAGSQFDTEIVKAFGDLKEENLRIAPAR